MGKGYKYGLKNKNKWLFYCCSTLWKAVIMAPWIGSWKYLNVLKSSKTPATPSTFCILTALFSIIGFSGYLPESSIYNILAESSAGPGLLK